MIAQMKDADTSEADTAEADDAAALELADFDTEDAKAGGRHPRMTPQRLAISIGLAALLLLGMLVCWLGFRVYQGHTEAEQHAVFVQVARQGAVNLTTINWNEADADVRRILDSATGTFHDDFAQRSEPFVDVLKQSHSSTEGTVTASGLESASENEAQVMVSVSVKTSSAAAPQQDPRSWRMRITVQKVGRDVKVSKVEFVP
jgi:Mce-associated membrane protein